MQRRLFIQMLLSSIIIQSISFILKEEEEKTEIVYQQGDEIHWFDDRGRIVQVEMVPVKRVRGITKHIREKGKNEFFKT